MANPSPSPSAAPAGAAPVSQKQQIAAAEARALAGSSDGTTTPDLYGLGQWRSVRIDPSGFPTAVTLLLQQVGIDTSKPVTGQQLAQALASIHGPSAVNAIQQLQQMLYYSGAYGTSVKSMSDLTLGRIGDQDIKALGNAITTAGQTGSAFGTYLTTGANYGKANGILAQITGKAANPVAMPDSATEDLALRAKAQQLFGHDPSADEYARFRAFFNQEILNEARQKTAAANPLMSDLPDANTLGDALANTPGSQFSTYNPNTGKPTVGEGGGKVPFYMVGPDGQPNHNYRPQIGEGASQVPFYMVGANGAINNNYRIPEQQQADQAAGVLGQTFNVASQLDNQGLSTYTAAPAIDSAAEDFLRQDNPDAIGQQNVATKYATLLNILAGTGR